MAHYLRKMDPPHGHHLWRIDADEAVRLLVTNPKGGPGTYFERGDAPSIWHAIETGTQWFRVDDPSTWTFHRLALDPGRYHPRMARPLMGSDLMLSPSARLEPNVVASGIGQATTLMRKLDLVCQTVHAVPETFHVFGHEIRNLLILASTEVETHWRGVLVANGVTRDRLTTRDYVKLLRPMKLDDYSVSFPSFPWLEPVRPFEGWSDAEPTTSLGWYDAYNGVKHNREREFHRANLRHAFEAVAACVVLLAAQFTRSIGLGGQSDLSAYFRFDQVPAWAPGDSYIDSCGAPEGHFGDLERLPWEAIPHPEL
jgi:hypothetical protein